MSEAFDLPLVPWAGRYGGTHDVPRHIHEGMELVYVDDGYCTCRTDDASVEGWPGELIILPAHVPHEQLTHEPTVTFFAVITGYQGVLDDSLRCVEARDERIRAWMESLQESGLEANPLPRACENALALTLLLRVAHLEQDDEPYHPAVREALAEMRRQLGSPDVSLDALAEAAGVSASHLSLLFRREVRTSPMQMLEQLRMDRAKQMLASSYDSVKAVAMACGYREASYFCRAFRRHMGCTPGTYRRQASAAMYPERQSPTTDAKPTSDHA